MKDPCVVLQFLATLISFAILFQFVQKALIGEKASLAVAEALGKVRLSHFLGGFRIITDTLPQDNYVTTRSPVNDMKAVKNATELEGFRQCHIRDGSALARYFAWLEEQLNNGVELNESQGADQLEKFRSWVFLSQLQMSILEHRYIGSSVYSRGFRSQPSRLLVRTAVRNISYFVTVAGPRLP